MEKVQWNSIKKIDLNNRKITNHPPSPDDTALVADSEEKLCRLVSEFGRVRERRKLRANVGNSKVVKCSRYGNGGRMHVILNGEPLEQCFSKWEVPPLCGRWNELGGR